MEEAAFSFLPSNQTCGPKRCNRIKTWGVSMLEHQLSGHVEATANRCWRPEFYSDGCGSRPFQRFRVVFGFSKPVLFVVGISQWEKFFKIINFNTNSTIWNQRQSQKTYKRCEVCCMYSSACVCVWLWMLCTRNSYIHVCITKAQYVCHAIITSRVCQQESLSHTYTETWVTPTVYLLTSPHTLLSSPTSLAVTSSVNCIHCNVCSSLYLLMARAAAVRRQHLMKISRSVFF